MAYRRGRVRIVLYRILACLISTARPPQRRFFSLPVSRQVVGAEMSSWFKYMGMLAIRGSSRDETREQSLFSIGARVLSRGIGASHIAGSPCESSQRRTPAGSKMGVESTSLLLLSGFEGRRRPTWAG